MVREEEGRLIRMNITIYDLLLWAVTLGVSFYTLSYALWLWKRKNKRGAVGVGILALLAFLYPGIILFFVH